MVKTLSSASALDWLAPMEAFCAVGGSRRRVCNLTPPSGLTASAPDLALASATAAYRQQRERDSTPHSLSFSPPPPDTAQFVSRPLSTRRFPSTLSGTSWVLFLTMRPL